MSSYLAISVLPDGTADTSVRLHTTGTITVIHVGGVTIQFSHPDHAAKWINHIRAELAEATNAPLPTLVAFAEETPGAPTVDFITADDAATIGPICGEADPGDDNDEVGADLGYCERPAGHDGNHRCTDGPRVTIWPLLARGHVEGVVGGVHRARPQRVVVHVVGGGGAVVVGCKADDTARLVRLAAHGVHTVERDRVHVGASADVDSLLTVFDVALPTGRTIVVHFAADIAVARRLRHISELALSYCAVEARWSFPTGGADRELSAELHLTPPEATR